MRLIPTILSPDEFRILHYAKDKCDPETYWKISKLIADMHDYDIPKIEFTSEEIETLEKSGALKDAKHPATL